MQITSVIFVHLQLLAFIHCNAKHHKLPVRSSPVRSTNEQHHPKKQCTDSVLEVSKQKVLMLIDNEVNPFLFAHHGTACSCGDAGWTEVAHLDMTDSNSTCPTGWTLYPSPRSCGRKSTKLIASAMFSVSGRTYSQVCGRVLAYQKGHPDAFGASHIGSLQGTDGIYIDGVSLTHGPPKSRKHIWSFVAAAYENGTSRLITCPCSSSSPWPHTIPSFVGINYFCESGNPGPTFSGSTIYHDNPLWDGKGCDVASNCCSLNSPPFFCATLSQPTSDDLELRIIGNELTSGEDARIFIADIFIK